MQNPSSAILPNYSQLAEAPDLNSYFKTKVEQAKQLIEATLAGEDDSISKFKLVNEAIWRVDEAMNYLRDIHYFDSTHNIRDVWVQTQTLEKEFLAWVYQKSGFVNLYNSLNLASGSELESIVQFHRVEGEKYGAELNADIQLLILRLRQELDALMGEHESMTRGSELALNFKRAVSLLRPNTPQSAKNILSNGVVSKSQSSINAFLEFYTDTDSRQDLLNAEDKLYQDGLGRICVQILRKSQKLAYLLGKDSFQHYALLDRKYQSPKEISENLYGIIRELLPSLDAHLKEVFASSPELGQEAHNYRYALRTYKDAQGEVVSHPSLELNYEDLIAGLSEMFKDMFGFEEAESDEYKPWPGASVKKVTHANSLIGLRVDDPYRRANKPNAAALAPVSFGTKTHPAVGSMIFPFASGDAGKSPLPPVYLKTIFHESGHWLDLLTTAFNEVLGLFAGNRYKDLNELISTTLELLTMDPTFLMMFFRDYLGKEITHEQAISLLPMSEGEFARHWTIMSISGLMDCKINGEFDPSLFPEDEKCEVELKDFVDKELNAILDKLEASAATKAIIKQSVGKILSLTIFNNPMYRGGAFTYPFSIGIAANIRTKLKEGEYAKKAFEEFLNFMRHRHINTDEAFEEYGIEMDPVAGFKEIMESYGRK